MKIDSCLLPPAEPVLWERCKQSLLGELWRLREQEQLRGGGSALGWIHHMRACTLRNIRLTQSCLVLVLTGEKTLLSGSGQGKVLSAGGALFLPAEEAISCMNIPGANEPYLALTVSFDAALLNRVRQRLMVTDKAQNGRSATQKTQDIAPLLECLHTFLRLLPVDDDPMLALMQQEQMVYILWKLGAPVFAMSHQLVNQIRALVEVAPHYSWSATGLAERLFMTERTLRRHLDTLGTSPSELIRISRLHCGLGMLMRQEMPVSEVAAHCGYASPSRFAARFRDQFGIAPSELLASRKKAGPQPRKNVHFKVKSL